MCLLITLLAETATSCYNRWLVEVRDPTARELNDKINSLTSLEREINSTRIVVVGDQSHGKSSLLEALSGIDLPRGEDIKTCVPLVMQLRNIAHGSPEHALISAPGNAPEKIELAAMPRRWMSSPGSARCVPHARGV